MDIRTKRIYNSVSEQDGSRVLVDGLWPRGLRKEEAHLDDWMRDLAPSRDLRKWFDHRPERWDGFVQRYHQELQNKGDLLEALRQRAKKGRVTLLFAARDCEYNNAVALRKMLISKN